MTKTIFALASAQGKAGVAVLRISGAQAGLAYLALTNDIALPKPRLAVLKHLKNPATQIIIDHALCLYFKAPYSFTGEDILELHIHGGRAVLEAVTHALLQIDGLRPAEAGEFSRRAFLNGKMDLTEAEGIADLVEAKTTAQAQQALRQMSGALSGLYEDWRGELIGVLALLESYVDFVEEEDVPSDVTAQASVKLESLITNLKQHSDDNARGQRLRNGVTIAILGPPNAGKSSLLNRLAADDIAIVSDIAGTTRDRLSVELDLNGYPVTVIDTAGLRAKGSDVIEEEGMRRARQSGNAADIRLLLFDGTQGFTVPDDFTDLARLPRSFVIYTKADLLNEAPDTIRTLSTTTGAGLENLKALIANELDILIGLTDAPSLTRARHRAAVEEALQLLQTAQSGVKTTQAFELTLEDLRLAARALGRVAGQIDIEDVLDDVFSQFCIGK